MTTNSKPTVMNKSRNTSSKQHRLIAYTKTHQQEMAFDTVFNRSCSNQRHIASNKRHENSSRHEETWERFKKRHPPKDKQSR